MSQAVHLYTDYAQQREWFECPVCHARQMVSPHVWGEVQVLGAKPTLDVCEHRPHIPPSPAAVAAHEDAMAMGILVAAIAGRS